MSLFPTWFSPTWFTNAIESAIRTALRPISSTIGTVVSILDGIRTEFLGKILKFWQKYSGVIEPESWDGIPLYIKNRPPSDQNMATAKIITLCEDILAYLNGGKKGTDGTIIPRDKSLFHKIDEVIGKIDGLPDLSTLATKTDLSTTERKILEAIKKANDECPCKEEFNKMNSNINNKIKGLDNKIDTLPSKMPKPVAPAPAPSPGPTPSRGSIEYIPPQSPFTQKDEKETKNWQIIDIDPYHKAPEPDNTPRPIEP